MEIGLPIAKSSTTDKRLFVSYSHKDTNLVGSVVSLVRATKGSAVFQDHDTIVPGTTWRAEIERGLVEAETVVVFWCRHAAASKEVRNEWVAAINAKKQLLPLLLDPTPLPEELATFQWIDFKEYGAPSHRRFWQNRVAIGLVTLGFVGALSLFLAPESPRTPEGSGEPPEVSVRPPPATEPATEPSALAPVEVPAPALPPPMARHPEPPKAAPKAVPPREPTLFEDMLADQPLWLWFLLLWIGVAAVIVRLYRRRHKLGKEKLFDERTKWPVRAVHHEMAKAIVAELSNRPE